MLRNVQEKVYMACNVRATEGMCVCVCVLATYMRRQANRDRRKSIKAHSDRSRLFKPTHGVVAWQSYHQRQNTYV